MNINKLYKLKQQQELNYERILFARGYPLVCSQLHREEYLQGKAFLEFIK